MAYVYRHIRLDTGNPFYIGIGSDTECKYTRAHSKQARNRYWHNVVNKHGYEVEILIDDISWQESLKKEVEFIAIHKRQQYGGLLINLTDGGEGNVGYITSEESKKKQSLKKIGKPAHNKGKPMPKHQLEILIKINKNRVHKTGIIRSEEWRRKKSESMKGKPGKNKGCKMSAEACLKMSLRQKGKPAWNKGIKMSDERCEINKLGKPRKGVMKYGLNGEFISEYRSLGDAAQSMNCSKNAIQIVCKGIGLTAKGFKWKYKSESLCKETPTSS